MAGRKKPVLTENFAKNLDAIEGFLKPEGAARFQRLLDQIFNEVIPTLRRFPRAGRSFLGRPPRSLEARTLIDKLKEAVGPTEGLREFIKGDYLVLYWIRKNEIIFLSIKHHRQLSFDLNRFWTEG